MFKTRISANASSEFIDYDLPGGAVLHIRRNHEAGELTVGVRDHGERRDVRVTICPSHCFGLGVSVTLEDGAETPLKAALHLGPVTLYFGARGTYGRRHPTHKDLYVEQPGILRRVIGALTGEHKRRKVSAVVDRFDGEMIQGPSIIARVVLWDDDTSWERGKSRQWSANLTQALWGKPTQTENEVIEEREVEVALPEGTYKMRAQLLQRVISWPRWPLVKLYRGVAFFPARMLVPRRKSEGLAFEGNRCGTSIVEGNSIRAGIANLIASVLRDRETYGGPNWRPKPVELYKDSHNLALAWVTRPEGVTDNHWVCERLLHGQTLWAPEPLTAPTAPDRGGVCFQRDPVDGGVLVWRAVGSPAVVIDGLPLSDSWWARVWPDSRVKIGEHEFIAYYSPIGPAPAAVQFPLVETAQPDEDALADVAEVAATLDTSVPSVDEVGPPMDADTSWSEPLAPPVWTMPSVDELGDLVDPGPGSDPLPPSSPPPSPSNRWEGD